MRKQNQKQLKLERRLFPHPSRRQSRDQGDQRNASDDFLQWDCIDTGDDVFRTRVIKEGEQQQGAKGQRAFVLFPFRSFFNRGCQCCHPISSSLRFPVSTTAPSTLTSTGEVRKGNHRRRIQNYKSERGIGSSS